MTDRHFAVLRLRWRAFVDKLRQGARERRCAHLCGFSRRLLHKTSPVLLEGSHYCVEKCLETALRDAFVRSQQVSRRPASSHRLPLGLLLLSRQELGAEQLRAALDAQREAGEGRIGEWLLFLGYVRQEQVTAALARQCSCPVLHDGFPVRRTSGTPLLPVTLLERCVMAPVAYNETTGTLHLAFAESLDYSVLYAVEQMTGCRAEPCMAVPSFVKAHLRLFAVEPRPMEVVFDGGADAVRSTHTILSYCAQLDGSEIRVNNCGPYIWVRIFRNLRPPMDLLFGAAASSSPFRVSQSRDLKFDRRVPIEAVVGQTISPSTA